MKGFGWWIDKLRLPLAMVGLGLAIIFWGNSLVEQTKESAHWPTTEGVIIESGISQSEWSTSTPSTYSQTQETEDRYSEAIRFEYRVQGILYTGSNVRLVNAMHSSADELQPILERYPVGKRVKVYYERYNPENAVLETTVDLVTYTPFYMGVMWSVVWGVVLMVFAVIAYFKEIRGGEQIRN